MLPDMNIPAISLSPSHRNFMISHRYSQATQICNGFWTQDNMEVFQSLELNTLCRLLILCPLLGTTIEYILRCCQAKSVLSEC
jgi:hypothetical protein